VKSDNTWMIVAALVGFWLWQSGKLTPVVVQPAPAVAVPAHLTAAAAPIKDIAARNPTVAKDLGARYRAFADVVRRDTGRLKSTDTVRAWMIDADALAIQGTPIVGALPGFGAAKDAVIKAAIGLDSVSLDASKRMALADALLAVAVALGG
jgi:hypothetical protein